MTEAQAIDLARQLANQYQVWYEVYTNGVDYMVIEIGDTPATGYRHYITISPIVKIKKE